MKLITNLFISLFMSIGLISPVTPSRLPPRIPLPHKVSLPIAKKVHTNIGATIGIMTSFSATGTTQYDFSEAVPVSQFNYLCGPGTNVQKTSISDADIYYVSSGQISDTTGKTIRLDVYDTTDSDLILKSMTCGDSCINALGKTVKLSSCP